MKDNSLDCYCVGFRRAAGAISSLYGEALAPVGLTISQYAILQSVSLLQPCSTSALAERLGLDRTTLVRTLKPLLEKGFIEDASEPNKRDRQLCLTQTGERTLEKAQPCWEAAQAEMESRFDMEFLDAVKAVPHVLGDCS